jgi:hypothetical protein
MQVAYAIAVVITVASYTVRWVRTQQRVRHLKQGRDGERDVALLLDGQRHCGAKIMRLVAGEPGTVSHVLICGRGIFVIQTRRMGETHKVAEMRFDGAQLQSTKHLPDAAPVVQCEAEVELIKALLRETTCKTFKVRAILVFLDSHVTRTSQALGSDIWVLNPNELERWIGREPVIMSRSEVAVATLHLTHYMNKLAA